MNRNLLLVLFTSANISIVILIVFHLGHQANQSCPIGYSLDDRNDKEEVSGNCNREPLSTDITDTIDGRNDKEEGSGNCTPEPLFTDITATLKQIEQKPLDDLEALLEEMHNQVPASDERLVSITRRLIYPKLSSTKPRFSTHVHRTAQANMINRLFQGKENGFFVECGAFDGEYASNTIFLEKKRQWSGLLIEADPYYFVQLLGKNRKAYKLHTCLSTKPQVTRMNFHFTGGQLGSLAGETEDISQDGMLCIPLYTALLALNQTNIDYLSLDVEGFELPILETIPFDKVSIKTLSLEFKHGEVGEKGYTKFMQDRGYDMVKRLVNPKEGFAWDLIFRKKDNHI